MSEVPVAGVAGFEPAHGGTKNRCLTAWLHPNTGALERAVGALYSGVGGDVKGALAGRCTARGQLFLQLRDRLAV